ncbi:alpha-amylase [bacterium]|nr:MAG: alpha-amylase [bacterium]
MKILLRTLFVWLSALFLLLTCSDKQETEKEVLPGDSYTQYATPFAEVPDTKDLVIYEVNLRAFSTEGDLQGVINRFNEIKALGVNTIWLMPIYEAGIVNSINSPYCIKNFKAVDTEYGSLDKLRELTDLAHENGVAVVLDWVANHTSWDNVWMENSSWYTQNSSGEIIHPEGTNWTDVADLNFNNAEMRFAMIDAMMYWALEANIDGFRCDYADGVPFDFWQSAISRIKSIPNRKFIFLAEGVRDDHLKAGFAMIYGWNYYNSLKNAFKGSSASSLYQTHLNEYNSVLVNRHVLRFTTNHDESAWDASPITLFGGVDVALTASAITIFMGGVPLLYSGQEVGRASTTPFFTKSPIDWTQNPTMIGAYKSLLKVYSDYEISKSDFITDFSTNDAVVFSKTFNNDTLLFIANIRNKSLSVSIPTEFTGLSFKNLINGNTVQLNSTLPVSNYEYYILLKD